MRSKIYIASPYTKGGEARNVRASLDAASKLADLGFIPFAPLLSHFWELIHPRPYTWWLEYDLQWIPDCDAILRLPGESWGADKEVEHARSLGKPVFHSIDDVNKGMP